MASPAKLAGVPGCRGGVGLLHSLELGKGHPGQTLCGMHRPDDRATDRWRDRDPPSAFPSTQNSRSSYNPSFYADNRLSISVMSEKVCNVEFPPDGPRQRTPVACKPCRQNKIRCGMRSPPCARCLRLNFHCTVEPCYRRVNQRDRMRHLEAEVQELRYMLQNNEERAANVQTASHTLGPVAFQPNSGLVESWEAPIAGTLAPGSQTNCDRRVGAEMVGEQEGIDLQERPYRVPDFTLGPVSLSKTQGEQLVNR